MGSAGGPGRRGWALGEPLSPRATGQFEPLSHSFFQVSMAITKGSEMETNVDCKIEPAGFQVRKLCFQNLAHT